MERNYFKTMMLLLSLLLVPQMLSAALLSVTAKKSGMNGKSSSGYFLVYQLSVGESGVTPSYKSSNTKVCTVDDNGKVTFSAKGEATITLTASGYDATEVKLSSDKYTLSTDCDLTQKSSSDLMSALKLESSNVSSQSASPKGFATISTSRVRFTTTLNGSYSKMFSGFTFRIKGDYFYTFVGQGAQCENGKTTVLATNPIDEQLCCYYYKIPNASKTPNDVEQSVKLVGTGEAFSMEGRVLLQRMAIYTPVSADEKTYTQEQLTRGLVALPSKTKGIYISWRMLADDNDNTTFDVLRDGKVIKSNIALTTSYNDDEGTIKNKYQIVTRQDGNEVETSPEVSPWNQIFMQIPIDKPAGGKLPDGKAYSYRPNDCSTGDVDGDGEYEIILKWDSAPSYDNGQNGYTAPTLLDCYKLDGTKLWRVNLGSNIRSGAHYTQFLVYDFDGDGKAEMICKTAPGSKDGTGRYVSEAATDETILAIDNTKKYVNSKGHVSGGEELLTVFNGQTGKAIHTIYYNPNRGMGYGGVGKYSSDWGDENVPYNRGERYLACVAHLNGLDKAPSAVMCRGYYTRAYLWAVNFDGHTLSTNWLHASTRSSEWSVTDKNGKTTTKTGCKATAYAQGAHNISVGDLDGDGCDEIMYGSAAINNDGTLMYSTDLRHGDAQHLGDLDPDRDGLEFFMVLEKPNYGFNFRNAKTGKVYFRKTAKSDTGRGMAADIDPDNRGYEMWSSASNIVYNCKGDSISGSRPSYNFRIYWDGDLQDELLGDMSNHNQPFLEKWDSKTKKIGRMSIGGKQLYQYGKSRTCNSTKGTPCLTADLFGDWREEMVFWCGEDSAHLNVFTTNFPTEYRFPTLMQDHIYRMGVAWQNVGYNQPPHLGYYLPDYALTRFVNVGEGASTQTVGQGSAIVPISYQYAHCKDVTLEGTLPDGLSLKKENSVLTISGAPKKMGTYSFKVKSSGDVSLKSISKTFTIKVGEAYETLTTQKSGFATYAASYPVQYGKSDGLKAYAIHLNEGTKSVEYEEVSDKVVPANQAVLVKGESAKTYTLAPATGAEDVFDTDLKASDGNITSDGKLYYAFSTMKNVPGFKLVDKGITIPSKKGYLELSETMASDAKGFFALENVTNGIDVISSVPTEKEIRYNLAGQRVDHDYKGIVIVNGKKVLNK